MTLALGIIIIILSIAVITLVLMQSGKGKELSSTLAGGSGSYGNTKINDKDKLLFKVTAVLSALLVVLVLVLYIIA